MAPIMNIPKSITGPVRVLHCLMSLKSNGQFNQTACSLSSIEKMVEVAAFPANEDRGLLLLNLIPVESATLTDSSNVIKCYSQTLTKLYSKFSGSQFDCSIVIENLRKSLGADYSSRKPFIPQVNSADLRHVVDSNFVDEVIRHGVNHTQVQEVKSLPLEMHLSPECYDAERSLQVNSVVDHGVLGGTFDSIHIGHKLLLSEAALRCRKSLTVGVTDHEMTKGKTLCELIRPVEERIKDVDCFLRLVVPSLETKIVPICNPFGPSIVDPDLRVIVVSEETLKGGLKVNEKRSENGLTPLLIHKIPVIEDIHKSFGEEDKVSSSSIRRRKLGTRLRPYQRKTDIPQLPHIIGLTGGIASGKSSIAKRLAKLGAGIVDCDALGHRAYLPGTECFEKIVQTFGTEIVDTVGTIDRKKLGAIVFSSREALTQLNAIVWPRIAELAKDDIKRLQIEGKTIVVLDAAVLLEARWDEFCHETWVAIIPPEEAVKRLMDRNGLDPEAAWKRVKAQLSNIERVRHADIVFSTLWEPEFTQQQVEKAWNEVLLVLENDLCSSL